MSDQPCTSFVAPFLGLCLHDPPEKTFSDVTGLHFQAAVPKYLRLEMQPASGSVVKAGGGSSVDQIVRITNSLQVTTYPLPNPKKQTTNAQPRLYVLYGMCVLLCVIPPDRANLMREGQLVYNISPLGAASFRGGTHPAVI